MASLGSHPALAYLKILRPINLALVAVTQWLIYTLVITKLVVAPILQGPWLILFILCTTMVAAAGYIVNDIFDADLDMINKPEKTYITTPINITRAWYYYGLLVLGGLAISFFVGRVTDNLQHLWLYPFSVFMLYMYASKYKNSVLVGNILVSAFVAGVIGILYYVEQFNLQSLDKEGFTHKIIISYIGFSFLLNLAREIIKDVEDVVGDAQLGLKTFPIVFGVQKAHYLVVGILCILLIGLSYLMMYGWISTVNLRLSAFVLILVPIIYLMYNISPWAKVKATPSQVSTFIKILMVMGLFFLILAANILLR
jgi:4-hydroxybenzoate polyprenyltransferase